MNKTQWFVSTIDPQAAQAAKAFGAGLEIAEYCTAWNMDEKFEETHAAVLSSLEGIDRSVLHGPFNELFPCAIDPLARQLAAHRYRQALGLAKSYGAEKLILHGGFNPWLFYPEWYVEQSILFWKDFLTEDPGLTIALENVLEPDPQPLLEIVKGVNHPRLRLCLDVGHVNAYSKVPAAEWLSAWSPYISHFHWHNNDGSWDTHQPLWEGTLPVRELLALADKLCPQATCTLELMDAAPSLQWLANK